MYRWAWKIFNFLWLDDLYQFTGLFLADAGDVYAHDNCPHFIGLVFTVSQLLVKSMKIGPLENLTIFIVVSKVPAVHVASSQQCVRQLQTLTVHVVHK